MILRNKFGRNPLILHYPNIVFGKYYSLWLLKEICFKITSGINDPDLAIITWNSKKEKGFLEKCLEKRGLKYLVGYHNPWTHFERIALTLQMLRGISTKYVLGLDNYDVLLFGSPIEVLSRFKRMGCKMLVNAEVEFFPNGIWSRDWKEHELSKAKTEFCYLNAGVWMGEVSFCGEFLERCLSRRVDIDAKLNGYIIRDCDQVVWHRTWHECFSESSDFTLDYYGDIAMNLSNAEQFLSTPKLIQ
jgi:hypothetical protein